MIPCGECPECRARPGQRLHRQLPAVRRRAPCSTAPPASRTPRATPSCTATSCPASPTTPWCPRAASSPSARTCRSTGPCLMSCCIPTGWGTVTKIANVQPGDSGRRLGPGRRRARTSCGRPRCARPTRSSPSTSRRPGASKAMELGATHFINSSKEDPVPIVQELTGGGVDFAFEATGDPGAIEQASGGPAPWPARSWHRHHGRSTRWRSCRSPSSACSRSRSSAGCTAPSRCRTTSPSYVDLAMTGDMKIDKIIEGKFKLEEINDIAERMERRAAERPLGLRVGLTGSASTEVTRWTHPRTTPRARHRRRRCRRAGDPRGDRGRGPGRGRHLWRLLTSTRPAAGGTRVPRPGLGPRAAGELRAALLRHPLDAG